MINGPRMSLLLFLFQIQTLWSLRDCLMAKLAALCLFRSAQFAHGCAHLPSRATRPCWTAVVGTRRRKKSSWPAPTTGKLSLFFFNAWNETKIQRLHTRNLVQMMLLFRHTQTNGECVCIQRSCGTTSYVLGSLKSQNWHHLPLATLKPSGKTKKPSVQQYIHTFSFKQFTFI